MFNAPGNICRELFIPVEFQEGETEFRLNFLVRRLLCSVFLKHDHEVVDMGGRDFSGMDCDGGAPLLPLQADCGPTIVPATRTVGASPCPVSAVSLLPELFRKVLQLVTVGPRKGECDCNSLMFSDIFR